MNIRLVGVALFHADGRTDVTRLIVAILNYFAIVRKMSIMNVYQFSISFLWKSVYRNTPVISPNSLDYVTPYLIIAHFNIIPPYMPYEG